MSSRAFDESRLGADRGAGQQDVEGQELVGLPTQNGWYTVYRRRASVGTAVRRRILHGVLQLARNVGSVIAQLDLHRYPAADFAKPIEACPNLHTDGCPGLRRGGRR